MHFQTIASMRIISIRQLETHFTQLMEVKYVTAEKMALINDITGFGRCSTAVMAPLISAMKIQAVAVPTAILSAHMQFPGYCFDDYTPKMRDYIQTYKSFGMEFDGIAAGFLGSGEQVDIVSDFI